MRVYPEGGYVFAAVTGSSVGVILSYFIVFVSAKIIEKINGAPFYVGDVVWILSGKHAGEKAIVCDIWKERNQVHVKRNEQDNIDFKEIYSFIEIFRVKPDRMGR